jgi:endonuclease/exonuclease/phosphatase family metal-dependent hydrolase
MKISVLQWNILFKEPINNIIKFLKQHPADIICLQELSTDLDIQNSLNAPKEIAKSLGFNYHKCEIPLVGMESKYKFILGNGIFTKYPITKTSQVVLQEASEPRNYASEKRIYIEVELNIDGKELAVGTTHLSFTKWFINNAKRQKEADKLLNVLKTKKHHYILTGDFNSTPNSYTVRNITKYLKNAGPNLKQKTFTTKPFQVDNFVAKKLDWRVDYVFTTPDIKTMNSQIMKTNYSDHLPVRAEFEI